MRPANVRVAATSLQARYARIGATLREARMRARIDVSEIEAKTKIRAKYLRALENEEWGLLPGPTFVKSFLRTYAQALGLDGKALVEEYRLSHERPSEPRSSRSSPARGRRARAHGANGRPGRAPRADTWRSSVIVRHRDRAADRRPARRRGGGGGSLTRQYDRAHGHAAAARRARTRRHAPQRARRRASATVALSLTRDGAGVRVPDRRQRATS